MSDRMMPLDEALEWVAQDKSTRSTARAARTVVAQAEQIKRLQNALQEVEDWGMNVLETLAYVGIIRPGDMEPPA
jgi:type II secretory pathway component PulF